VAAQYQAAIASRTGFKMFLSFDVTSLSCSSPADAASFRTFINRYANSPAQLYFYGRPLVSAFSGENCYFGQGSVDAGWSSVVRDASVPPVGLAAGRCVPHS
jgi:glucan endo-1,3-alpha-glucosidase